MTNEEYDALSKNPDTIALLSWPQIRALVANARMGEAVYRAVPIILVAPEQADMVAEEMAHAIDERIVDDDDENQLLTPILEAFVAEFRCARGTKRR